MDRRVKPGDDEILGRCFGDDEGVEGKAVLELLPILIGRGGGWEEG